MEEKEERNQETKQLNLDEMEKFPAACRGTSMFPKGTSGFARTVEAIRFGIGAVWARRHAMFAGRPNTFLCRNDWLFPLRKAAFARMAASKASRGSRLLPRLRVGLIWSTYTVFDHCKERTAHE